LSLTGIALHFILIKFVFKVVVMLNEAALHEDVWEGGGTAQHVRLGTTLPVRFTVGKVTPLLPVQEAEWVPEPLTRYGEKKSFCPLRELNPCRTACSLVITID
jgi:hypothetical protein